FESQADSSNAGRKRAAHLSRRGEWTARRVGSDAISGPGSAADPSPRRNHFAAEHPDRTGSSHTRFLRRNEPAYHCAVLSRTGISRDLAIKQALAGTRQPGSRAGGAMHVSPDVGGAPAEHL